MLSTSSASLRQRSLHSSPRQTDGATTLELGRFTWVRQSLVLHGYDKVVYLVYAVFCGFRGLTFHSLCEKSEPELQSLLNNIREFSPALIFK